MYRAVKRANDSAAIRAIRVNQTAFVTEYLESRRTDNVGKQFLRRRRDSSTIGHLRPSSLRSAPDMKPSAKRMEMTFCGSSLRKSRIRFLIDSRPNGAARGNVRHVIARTHVCDLRMIASPHILDMRRRTSWKCTQTALGAPPISMRVLIFE